MTTGELPVLPELSWNAAHMSAIMHRVEKNSLNKLNHSRR